MTRPARRPTYACVHCGQRILPVGRSWTHDLRRDNRPDECIVNSQYTGDLAHPANEACPHGCAGRMQMHVFAEGRSVMSDPLLTESAGWSRCCDCGVEIELQEPCVDMRNNKGDIACCVCADELGLL